MKTVGEEPWIFDSTDGGSKTRLFDYMNRFEKCVGAQLTDFISFRIKVFNKLHRRGLLQDSVFLGNTEGFCDKVGKDNCIFAPSPAKKYKEQSATKKFFIKLEETSEHMRDRSILEIDLKSKLVRWKDGAGQIRELTYELLT